MDDEMARTKPDMLPPTILPLTGAQKADAQQQPLWEPPLGPSAVEEALETLRQARPDLFARIMR